MSEYLTEPIFVDGKKITSIAKVPEGSKRGLRRIGKIKSKGGAGETDVPADVDGTPLNGLLSSSNVKKFAAAGIVTLEKATDHFEEHGDFTAVKGIAEKTSDDIALELGLVERSEHENTDEDDSEEDDSEEDSAE